MPSYHRSRMSKAIQRQLVIHVIVALLTDSFPLSARALPTLPTGFSGGVCVGGGDAVAAEVNVGPWLLSAPWYDRMLQFVSWRSVTYRSSASSYHATCPRSSVAVSNKYLVTGWSVIICLWVKRTGRRVLNTCTSTSHVETRAAFLLYACQVA